MRPILFPLDGGAPLAAALAAALDAELGEAHLRRFPDGETYLRLEPLPAGREVVLVQSLDDPDAKTMALLLAAAAARDHGAASVGLVAPYLAYMRQDTAFQPGEPVSARVYAALLSEALDWLVTVDPHLHRIDALSRVYAIPTRVAHAAPLLAEWIGREIAAPLLIGPDVESEQWVAAVAARAGAPWAVLRKHRLGDRQVRIEAPDLGAHRGRTVVLVDDMTSSGKTLIEAADVLAEQGFAAPVCVVVHDLTNAAAAAALTRRGLTLASVDTVVRASNRIACAPLLAEAVAGLRSTLRG